MSTVLIIILVIGAAIWLVRKGNKTKESSGYSASGLPPGFIPTHSHKNIAVNANAGTIWLRDETGFSKVLMRSQILRWNLDSKTFNNQITGRPGRSEVKLVVTTTDLDHPIYRIRFNGHSDATMGGGNSNYQEAETWSSRMTAFSADNRSTGT